jgi:hypothetical protein
MKLYPLGLQRDLKDEFDEVDFGAEGLLKPNVLNSRRYSGLYTKILKDQVDVHYYDFCEHNMDSFEIERIYSNGYKRSELRDGRQHPLYVCHDIYVIKNGEYKKVYAERKLLPYRTAKILLKEYLDPYYYKPNQATKDYFKIKQRSDVYE